MIAFLAKLIFGHVRRHRLEALLCLVGVALGVAVTVAVDAAVTACVQSFAGAVGALAERSTHSVFAGAGTLTDEQYIALLRRDLPFPLSPMIDRRLAIGDTAVRLIGVDVFAERRMRSLTQVQSSLDDDAFRRFMTEPGAVVLVKPLADALHATVGSTLRMTVGPRRADVHVVGIVVPTGVGASELDDLVLADLATAQELTDTVGRLDRIDTVLGDDADVAALTAALPAGAVLRSTSQRQAALGQLIQSYRLNLNALSLMASFVAVFIVYNSMLISVQQRATSLGILRCLGSGRWQLGGLYAAEAVLYAAVGGVAGVVGGWGLSHVMVGYIATTINDMYAAVRPTRVPLDAALLAKGMAVALGSCAVGAIAPLVRASQVPPVNAFRSSEGHRAGGRASLLLAGGGAGLLSLAWVAYLVPGESPLAGFAMAGLVAVGFALACPWVTRAACGLVSAVARPLQALPVQMAAAGVGRSLGITGVAVAATMLAMGMNIGIRTMVSSFRTSLDAWMDRRFDADVFIGPELTANHKADATLDPGVEAWVRTQPNVRHVVEYRAIDIPLAGKLTMLTGTDVAEVLRSLPTKSRAPGEFDPAADALVSEPLAGRTHWRVGDTITIDTPTGPHRFRVYAVFYDFGTERGQLMLDRAAYIPDWRDDAVNAVHVSLVPGSDRASVARAWAAYLRPLYPVVVDTLDDIKVQAMTVFDRTFRVTVVLTWLSGGVAFCGLAGSLLSLALARRRDYGLLAAVGMTGRQLAAWVLAQGLLIAWASALVAAVAGTVLAYVLAYVIQYRSFGWSIPTHAHPRFWAENVAMATVAAVAAAVYPIVRLRATPPAADLRVE
jgi:putative ABC transport system permease protein